MKYGLTLFLQKAKSFEAENERTIRRTKNCARHIILSSVRAVILSGLAFVLLYPLLYMLSMAFRPSGQLMDPTVIWIPRSLTFENIIQTAGVLQLGKSISSTAMVGLVSSMLQIASCSIVGYGFARFEFRFKKILFILVIIQIILPPQTLIIPQYIDFRYFDFFFLGRLLGFINPKLTFANLLDTPAPFYLLAAFGQGIRSGLLIFIFRQFFRGLPRELEDAACVDGCGPVKTFLRVMAPNAGTAFLTVFLFSVVWYWNDYYLSGMFLTTIRTLSVRLSTLGSELSPIVGKQNDPYKMICQIQAGSLIVISPPLLLYIIFQRYFVESIERTGIVG